jgi:hypothetical protein
MLPLFLFLLIKRNKYVNNELTAEGNINESANLRLAATAVVAGTKYRVPGIEHRFTIHRRTI